MMRTMTMKRRSSGDLADSIYGEKILMMEIEIDAYLVI